MSAMENAGILKLQIYELGFIKVLGKLESCPLEIAGGGGLSEERVNGMYSETWNTLQK